MKYILCRAGGNTDQRNEKYKESFQSGLCGGSHYIKVSSEEFLQPITWPGLTTKVKTTNTHGHILEYNMQKDPQ